ncbi:MAG: NAD(P)-dependent oxidoreductase [Chloroflexota bacterium]
MKVVVTGSSGRVGRYVVRDLLEAGYDVTATDTRPPAERACRFVAADLCDLGQAVGMLSGHDAVVHLAAIPSPGGQPDEVVFETNVRSTFNVLQAAAVLGIRRAVCASSLSAYGTAYASHEVTPRHIPLDEDHPLLPQDPYGLSKGVGEEIAATIHRRTGMVVASMRFAFVITPEGYGPFSRAGTGSEAGDRRILWCYIDVRDAARACRLALEAPAEAVGCQPFNIIAPDTFRAEPTALLARRGWPELRDIRGDDVSTWAPVDGTRARRVLGFVPAHLWEMAAPRVRGQNK